MPEGQTTKQANKKVKGRYYKKPACGGANEENAPGKILKAARKVFARFPFSAATTRTIAKEAGIEHPLIHYYFGSKENLFEIVCSEIYDELSKANKSWLEGLERKSLQEGLSLFLDRLLAYSLEHPEPFHIILLNMVQAGSHDIPGYEYIMKDIERNQLSLEEKFPFLKSRPNVKTYLIGINSLIISFLGARASFGKMLGIDPHSSDYREWAKNTLYLLFLPWHEKLFLAEKEP